MRFFSILLFVGSFFAASHAPTLVAQVPGDDAYQAMRDGDYLKARERYTDRLQRPDSLRTMSVVYFAETFLALGDYEDGLEAIDALTRDASKEPYVLHARGLLLDEMGRYEEAEKAYYASAALKDDLWRNVLSLAELFEKTGRRSQANDIFTYIYRPYKNNTFRTAEDLGVAARAAAFLGEFRDANEAFNTAYQIDPRHVRNIHWWGELFRIKYNDADAQRTLEEGLKANANYAPMYTAYARSVKGFGQKEQLVQEALGKNPRHVEAFAIMASLHILDGLYDEASTLLKEALEINPSHIESLAHLATVHFLQGDSVAYNAIEEQAFAVNPRPSAFYVILARNCDLKFRYPDAIRFAEQAARFDRNNPEAYAQLGTSLLRLGRSEEAKRYLDLSFEVDPYNLFVGNMLTLIEAFDDFAFLESEHFSLLIHQDEQDVMGPAILELAEQSFEVLSKKYPYTPARRILLEAYNDQDDFAVRVAGVPHLGLLGVSFGDVLAINTPRSMDPNTYNWARTLWHELVHTMSIGLANYKLPRWFAEGLAVYEEQEAREEWGREMQITFLQAFEEGKLLALNEMDRGFTRPTYPGQILLSYYHASRVVEYIVTIYGFDAIIAILNGYAANLNDEESIRAAIGIGLDELDKGFRAWVQQEKSALADVIRGMPNPFAERSIGNPLGGAPLFQNAFMTQLKDGAEALDNGAYDEAEVHFRRALTMYKKYTEPGNPYLGLAEVYRATREDVKLIGVLEEFLAVSEHGLDESIELAQLLEENGDIDKATHYYERSLDVSPYNREVQTRLAEMYAQQGQWDEAVQARQALLGLNPVDRADAYYQYAISLKNANRPDASKRATLQSLELAPGFRDAQKLLLQLVEQ